MNARQVYPLKEISSVPPYLDASEVEEVFDGESRKVYPDSAYEPEGYFEMIVDAIANNEQGPVLVFSITQTESEHLVWPSQLTNS
jgi:hypothetical protein